jgi:hypothetical protein
VLKVVGDTVISGNQRLDALIQLGYEEAIVLTPNRELTEDEKTTVALESNRSDGQDDLDKLFALPKELLEEVGWDNKEIQKLIDGHTEAKEDDYDVDEGLKQPCNVARGDIWQLGGKVTCPHCQTEQELV